MAFSYFIGLTGIVSATFDLISDVKRASRCDSQLMKAFEGVLCSAWENYNSNSNLTRIKLVDFIIAGERFKLQSLLFRVIRLASKSKSID